MLDVPSLQNARRTGCRFVAQAADFGAQVAGISELVCVAGYEAPLSAWARMP